MQAGGTGGGGSIASGGGGGGGGGGGAGGGGLWPTYLRLLESSPVSHRTRSTHCIQQLLTVVDSAVQLLILYIFDDDVAL